MAAIHPRTSSPKFAEAFKRYAPLSSICLCSSHMGPIFLAVNFSATSRPIPTRFEVVSSNGWSGVFYRATEIRQPKRIYFSQNFVTCQIGCKGGEGRPRPSFREAKVCEPKRETNTDRSATDANPAGATTRGRKVFPNGVRGSHPK